MRLLGNLINIVAISKNIGKRVECDGGFGGKKKYLAELPHALTKFAVS